MVPVVRRQGGPALRAAEARCRVGLSFSPSSYSLQLQGDEYSFDIVRATTDGYGNPDPNISSALTTNLTDSSPGHGAAWQSTSVSISANQVTSGPALYKNPTHNESVTLTATATASGYSAATITYSVTSSGSNPTVGYTTEAQATDTNSDHSTSTGSYASTTGATELVLIYRVSNSSSSDSVTSVTGPFSGVTEIGSVDNFVADSYLWAYVATGNGAAASVTAHFNSAFTNTSTFVYVVQLSGSNTTGPVAQSLTSSGASSPTNSSWSNSNATNGELLFAGAEDTSTQAITIGTPSSGSWSATTASGTSGTIGYGVGMFESTAAQSSVSSNLSLSQPWGAITIELNHG
jgi:hypothetical protein